MHPIAGTRWRITGIDGRPTIAPDAREPHLTLDAESDRFAASAGCNNMMGSYDVDGAAITLTSGGMTMMMCDEALMGQERALLDAFAAVRTLAIDGARLELLDTAGTVVISALAAEGA